MPPYRRSIFLINKGFQIRFALYVCTWLFALSFIYPLIVFNLFDYFIAYAAKDPNGPAIEQLNRTRDEILVLLMALQVVFVGVTFLISIFMSHRIAGPLFKLKKFFAMAGQGNIKDVLAFREKDHFQDIATDYNAMMQGIRGIIGQNTEEISAAIHQIERAKDTGTSESRLQLEAAITSLKKVREKLPK